MAAIADKTFLHSHDDLLTYKLRMACIDTNSAGTLNVSKKTSAAFSLFLRGFSGASVSNTGCCEEKCKMWSLTLL